MCDPFTLTALTVAATVVTAGAQVYAGKAAYAQGKFESQIAERNAKLEEASREDAFNRRNIEQMRLWRHVTQQLGEQRAEAAGQGLAVDFGSPLDLQTDTMQIGIEDSSTLNDNYNKEIKGYDINAANYRAQGASALMRGKAARTGGYLSAAGTLLSGASQVGRMNSGPSGGSGGGNAGLAVATFG